MSRTPKTIVEAAAEPALNEAALAVVGAAPAQLAIAQESLAEMLDLGRRLGQMETAAFVGNISDGILLSSFENVKKSKAWKLLHNKSGEIFPSLDAFCSERLGFSARRLSQIQGNRDMLGQETFSQAEQLGLRQIDYNAIKALPAPDQELVRRAIEEAQSRDEVIDLMQELAVRHAKEKENLKSELDDARDQAEDLAASKKSVEKDLAEARKQARQFANATPDEQAETLRTKLQKKTLELEAVMTGELRDSVEELVRHGDEASLDQRAWVKAQLGLMLDRLQNLAARAGVELAVQADTPAWLNPAAIPATGAEAVQ